MTDADKALAVLHAIARLVANGGSLTIAHDWGLGTATLIDADGAHTHVGGDWENSDDANLRLLVSGLHDQLVSARGLSWVKAMRRAT